MLIFDEIRVHIIDEGYTHFVVFEDDHLIEQDLNPIMKDYSVGLQDEHIEKAIEILNN